MQNNLLTGYSAESRRVTASTETHRCGTPQSRNLVIINKGPGAVRIPREGNSWDLMEIYFAKQDLEDIMEDPSKTDADFIVFERDRNMRKFAIIKRVFEMDPDLFNYEVVMMLDDDLIPVGCKIADIFKLFAETGLRIGQPALSIDSYWSHEVVLRNAEFRWRRTNFVEVMCPLMTMAALRHYSSLFDETVSAFGLDVYWSAEEWRCHGGLAVLDATPMRHIRPVRGGVAYQGLSPGEERYDFFRRHKLKNFRHLTIDGETMVKGAMPQIFPVRYRSQIPDLLKFKIRSIQRIIGFCLFFTVALLRSLIGGKPPALLHSLTQVRASDSDHKDRSSE